ncbi:hypothetical protein B0186_00965 [Canicola haemoglobinophilus]|uniref:Large adhesin n=1 Tax=Canicola haemoglobinophilus TaxID=733 RepID=A0A1V4B3L5_9PAST|nr:YadA-like family protein [Canicola haemoglobinophilus]OOS01963.1 hypothetical protein B0186_00965 [Canicola haemoglobinophilus]STO60414.1 large adhesin [Canicola haemoglobinophilus]
MNKIFRVIWSKTLNTFVVVSELATGQRKSSTNSAIKPSKINSQHNLSFALNPVTLAMGIFAKNKTALKYSAIGVLGTLSYLGAVKTYATSTNIVFTNNSDPHIIAPHGTEDTFKSANDKLGALGSIILNPSSKNYGNGRGLDISKCGATCTISEIGKDKVHRFGVAIGTDSEAEGDLKEDGSKITLNNQADTLANYGQAVAVGFRAKAKGLKSVALGASANAYGGQSVSLGSGSYSFHRATALGNEANASANFSVALGDRAKSSANSSIAIGLLANASGSTGHTIAIGVNATTASDAIDAIALGHNAFASSNYSISIGYGIKANEASVVIGNNGTGSFVQSGQTTTIAKGSVIIGDKAWVGDTVDASNKGNNGEAQGITWAAVAIGKNSRVHLNRGVAIGRGATVTTKESVAIGSDSKTTANLSAFGYDPSTGKLYTGSGNQWKPNFGEFAVGDGNTGNITGLANANLTTSSTEAVSGKQLTDLATTLGVEVNTDNKTFKPKTFTKVEGGELNSGATNVTSAVEQLISAVNKGLKFTGNNASEVITRKLDETLKIQGEGDTAPTSTAKNNINVKANTTTNTLEIQLASNLTNLASVGHDANNSITFGNGGSATTFKVGGSAVVFTKDNDKVKISNVATPIADYDAANKKYVDDQVKEANDKLTNKVNEVDANRPFVFMLNENGKEVEVVKGRDGKLYKKDELKDATYQDGKGYMTAKGQIVNSLRPDQTMNVTIAASKITPDHLALSVGNVASGLGLTGNYTSGSKGNLAKPDAIDVANATTKITELVKDNSSFTGTALNKVATVGDLQAVAIAGLNFAGNTGTNVHKKLTDTLAIVGNKTLFEQAQQKVLSDMGLTQMPDTSDSKRSDYEKALQNATKAITDRFSDKNVITTTDGKEISIKVAERPEFKGIDVTDPKSDDSVAIDPDGINIADGHKSNVIDKDGVSVNDADGNSSSLSANGVNVEGENGSSELSADNLSFETQDGRGNAKYGADGAEIVDDKNNRNNIDATGLIIADDDKSNIIDKEGIAISDSDGNSSNVSAEGVNVEGENGSSTLAAGKLSLTDQKGTDSVVINAGNEQHGPSIDFAHDETGKARGRINGLADITADETDGSIAANKNYVDARIKEATSGQPFEYATKGKDPEKVVRGLDNKLYKESELNNYYYDSKEGKYKPKDATKPNSLNEIANKDVIVNVMPKGEGKDPITIGNVESILGKDASTDKDQAASAIKQLIDNNGTLAEKKDNVATGSDVAALAKAGLDFGANVGDDIHKNLGEKVSIVGKDLNKEAKDAVLKEMGITDVPADGAPNKADYDAKYKEALAKSKKAVTEGFSAKNVATEIKNNQVVIKIADKPEFKALSITDEANPDVTTDLAPDGVVIADEQGNSHDVSVKGSVITDENGNSNSITATDVVLSSGDNESKLEAGKLTLAKSDGNNNNKVIVEVTDKGGKLTGLEARDVTAKDYGKGDNAGRAATESAVKKTYEDVKNGVLGPLVFTDKEGNRLVNVDGKYYKAKDVKADGTVDPKAEEKSKDAVLSLVHVGQSNTDPVVDPTVLNNVAPGEVSEHSKQAVNGAQLYQTNLAIQSNASRIDGLQSQINTVDKNMRAGVAQAVAQANLPQVFLPGKSTLSLATGHYMGTQAFAMGYSRVSDNGKVIVKFSLGHGDKQTSVGAGVGYTW